MPQKPALPAPTLPVPEAIVSFSELGMFVFSGCVESTLIVPAADPCVTSVQNSAFVGL